jgi:ribosomal subunit interface protein
MQLPLQITFRNLEHSDAIEAKIRQCAAKLDKFCDRIISCQVVVEAPHRHHHKGNLYHIRLNLTLPQGEVVIKRDPAQDHAHEDVYVAIRDAFAAAERQLKDTQKIHRHEVKTHDVPSHGHVITVLPEEGYGFIQTSDGQELYFHENSLLNGRIRDLPVGSDVRFVQELGEKGPQASSVRLMGKHHLHS